MDVYEVALSVLPSVGSVYTSLGVALERLGRNQQASQAYLRASHLDPADSHAYNNLGNLVYRSGKQDTAMQLFGLAMQLRPNGTADIRCHRNSVLCCGFA